MNENQATPRGVVIINGATIGRGKAWPCTYGMASPGLPCERRMAVGQWMMTTCRKILTTTCSMLTSAMTTCRRKNWPADHDPPPDDRELGVPDRLMTMRTLGATASSVLGGDRHAQ